MHQTFLYSGEDELTDDGCKETMRHLFTQLPQLVIRVHKLTSLIPTRVSLCVTCTDMCDKC